MRKILICLCLTLFAFADDKENNKKYEDLELFSKVLNLVESQYYRKVDRKELIEGALKGMMDTLDPHSAYLNTEYYKKMQSDTNGEFGGLGIEITQRKGSIYIVTPIDDTPAFKAGIEPGDKIVEIDKTSLAGKTMEEAVKLLKGDIGQKITLGVEREGSTTTLYFPMKRENIEVRPVKWKVLGDFGWFRLTQFQRNSHKYLVKALKKAEANKLKGIVLDLRNNPGGLLDQAVDISSIFLDKGVVVSTEARNPKDKEIKYVKKTGHKVLKTPIVVLVNGASASASEIVAGALQDNKRALIVGTQSFGKGSVQSVARVGADNGIKLTIAQYMTPNNRKIQAVGITPDIQIAEATGKFLEKYQKDDKYIREKDLKNHLSASEKRVAKTKNKKSKFTRYNPKEDFQIQESIKILKSLNFSRTL